MEATRLRHSLLLSCPFSFCFLHPSTIRLLPHTSILFLPSSLRPSSGSFVFWCLWFGSLCVLFVFTCHVLAICLAKSFVTLVLEVTDCHPSHFGSGYTLGCCAYAGLLAGDQSILLAFPVRSGYVLQASQPTSCTVSLDSSKPS